MHMFDWVIEYPIRRSKSIGDRWRIGDKDRLPPPKPSSARRIHTPASTRPTHSSPPTAGLSTSHLATGHTSAGTWPTAQPHFSFASGIHKREHRAKCIEHFISLNPVDPDLAQFPYPQESVPLYSLAHQLVDSWYCYWSDDFSVPKDPETNYTFRPPLRLTGTGVVVSGRFFNSPDPVDQAKYMEAHDAAREAVFGTGVPILMDGMGSEGSVDIEPFVAPMPTAWAARDWPMSDEDAKTFALDLLTEHLHAHAADLAPIAPSVLGAEEDEEDEEDEDEDNREETESLRL
eukprot:gene12053-15158_t